MFKSNRALVLEAKQRQINRERQTLIFAVVIFRPGSEHCPVFVLFDVQGHQNHPQDHQNHPQDHQNHPQGHPQPRLGVILVVLEVILVVLEVVLV